MGDNFSNNSFAAKYAKKSGGQSFADSVGKKSFTSENLQSQSSSHQSKANSSQQPSLDSDTNHNSINKIDPRKMILANLIYLVKGIDDGRNAWYYVLVDRLKVQLFLKALNDEIIHLENYGKILFSAYGDEPPSEITDQLKEEYGIQ
jgi:hypothetical protein